MLGVKPLLGRLYTREEYHVDLVQVVISHKFWQEQLGGDPHVVGRTLDFDGTAQTIIGVMPTLPDLYPDTDVWAKDVPDFQWMRVRNNRFLMLMGRLKAGVTRQQAEQELAAILHRGPAEPPASSVTLVPLKDEVTGKVRPQLEIVMASAGLVLLIMCANITYLLLARSSRRQAEIAMRISLGAGTGRILRQFVTENLLIALVGGGIGLVLASNCVALLARLNPGNLPRGRVIGVDPYVLIFAFAISLGTSLLVACARAAIFSRLDLHSTLRAGRGEAGNFGKSRFRALLVSEVSLAVVLLVAAGLLVRSFWAAEHLDPGFHPDHLLTAYLRTSDYPDGRNFFPELVERAPQLPGVQAAAVANCLPASGALTASLIFNDRANDPYHVPEVAACWISPDFFRAIGTRLLAGRFFTARDNAAGPPTVNHQSIAGAGLLARERPDREADCRGLRGGRADDQRRAPFSRGGGSGARHQAEGTGPAG
jgi:putative ABC transport system permease protein